MAETVEEAQDRIEGELVTALTELAPGVDFSTGTVVNELVVKPAAFVYAQQEVELEVTRENYSLVQVLNSVDPDPTHVDRLLSNFNILRKEGTVATGTLNIYVTTDQNVYIAANTEFSCGGIRLRPVKAFVGVTGAITAADTAEVAYIQTRAVNAGTRVFSITASTVEAMKTALSPGQVCTSTLSNSQVSRTEVGSTFTGGTLQETTSDLLARSAVSISSKVLTGRDNIRAFLTGQDQVNVVDAEVFGMGDDLMVRDAGNSGIGTGGRIDSYVATSPLPVSALVPLNGTKDTGTGVWTVVIPADSFAGAYGVLGVRYLNSLLDTALTTVLNYTPSVFPLVNNTANARYSQYQTLSVQFEADFIPGEVAAFEAEVLYMPGMSALQDYMNSEAVRSRAFDNLIRAVIPVIIEADLHIQYVAGITPPTKTKIQNQVAAVVNAKSIGTEALFASDLIYAVSLLFGNGVVRTPVNMRARVFMPDGTQAFTASQNYIKVLTTTGVSPDNSSFFVFPADINVAFTEISG